LLNLLAFISEILPIILYLSFIKRNRGQGLWVIFLYCVCSLVTQPLFLLLLPKVPKFYFFVSWTILEFTLFSIFLSSSLERKKFKYIPIIGALIFYGIAFMSFIGKNQEDFDSLTASVEAILVIIYCIYLLYEQISDPSIIFVYNSKKFWVIIAFFLYFSSTLFLFLFAGNFTKKEYHNYWAINNFFEILKNILFSIAFIMKKRDKTEYSIDTLDPDI
jgi:hypothetical protein